jgi:hypothetical protein
MPMSIIKNKKDLTSSLSLRNDILIGTCRIIVSEVKYFPAIASSIEIIKTGDVQLGTHWKPLVETDLKLKSSPNKVLTYSPFDSGTVRIAIKTNKHIEINQ